jgi:excisionase family DNA binding protein
MGKVTPIDHTVAASRPPSLLRVRDVEADLGLGKSKIYDMIGKGELKAVRIGRSVRVPRVEVERFLEELGVE